MEGSAGNSTGYRPKPGLSVPLVTIFDDRGEVVESEQRALVRFLLQDGDGADILFAAGTTGEWDRVDNRKRQEVCRIVAEEAKTTAKSDRRAEVWAGVTAHSRHETLDNIRHSIDIGADAAVVAPLSISDSNDPVEFVLREIGGLFEKTRRSIPIFLYDNAEISAPGHAPHMHTRDVKRLSRLEYVHGVKVTAGKQVLGNYTKAASHFRSSGEFAIYAGDPYLIFDLFAPPTTIAARLRYYWNRYLTRRAVPAGIVAGPSNVFPREWKRAWTVCRAGDDQLMDKYHGVLTRFRNICAFERSGRTIKPTIACLKAALAEMGVIETTSVAQGTTELSEDERREFGRRFQELRREADAVLESAWVSRSAGRDRLRAVGAR